LETLSRLDLKICLKNFRGRSISEKHGKWGSDGYGGWIGVVLFGPGLISGSKQWQTDQKMGERVCGGSL